MQLLHLKNALNHGMIIGTGRTCNKIPYMFLHVIPVRITVPCLNRLQRQRRFIYLGDLYTHEPKFFVCYKCPFLEDPKK